MRTSGLVRVALLALIWGSGFLLIKVSLRSFTPVGLTFARLALGAVVLVAVLLVRRVGLPHGRALWLHLTVAALPGTPSHTPSSAWRSRPSTPTSPARSTPP